MRKQKLHAAIDNARGRAGAPPDLAPGADRSPDCACAHSLAEAVANADFIQENAPEREEIKQGLLAEIDKAAKPGAIIASSTSGLLPSRLQARMAHPERLVVGHPFNPVYLLPLVEVLGGEKTSAESIQAAKAFYTAIGMRPLHVRVGGRGLHRRQADGSPMALAALWFIRAAWPPPKRLMPP